MSTLKVGTIQDHANSITAMTIDNTGHVAMPNTKKGIFQVYSNSRYLVISLQTSDTNYTDMLLTGRSSAIDTTGTTYDGIYISGVVPLTANQFVLCKAEMENSSNCVVSDKSCYFTGYLIG